MIWIVFFATALMTGLFLVTPFLETGDTPPARGKTSLALLGFTLAGLVIYTVIGRPELTAPKALKAYQPPPSSSGSSGPSAADIKAAQEMSNKERAAMINAMVEGLAQKLQDNPDNPQGWARLLRARTVLGQEAQRAKDIETVKALYTDRPEVLAQLLGE